MTIPSINGSCLPRSIRWRIQLGLLKVPSSGEGFEILLTENDPLVQEQRKRYETYVSLHDGDRFQSIHQDHNDENAQEKSKLDPLSFLAQEKEAKEAHNRRESMNRMKSSLADVVKSHDIIKIIKKDLDRLEKDHASLFRSQGNPAANEAEKLQERNEILTEILHIFAKRNKETGYGQGMHELASYCLLAGEMDLIDAEVAKCHDYENVMSYEYLRHDTFSLFEALMKHMKHAYTHLEEATAAEEKSHEDFGIIDDTILHKVLYISNDKSLYMHLQKMEFSTSLYCARWIRLMFAREAGGMQSTLKLWDVLFDCITMETGVESKGAFDNGSRREESQRISLIGKFKLKPVLEMTAASLLWLHKDYIFSRNPDEALQEIHSQGALENLTPLITALFDGLRNLKKSSIKAKCKSTRQRSLSPPQKVSPKFSKRLSMAGWIARNPIMSVPLMPTGSTENLKSVHRRHSSEQSSGAESRTYESYAVPKRGSVAASVISHDSTDGVRSISPENDLLEGFPGCDDEEEEESECHEELFPSEEEAKQNEIFRGSLLSRQKSKADLLLMDLESSQHNLFHESLDMADILGSNHSKRSVGKLQTINSDSEAELKTVPVVAGLQSSHRSLSLSDIGDSVDDEQKNQFQPKRRSQFSRRGSLPRSHIVKVEEIHSLLLKNKEKAQLLLTDLMSSQSKLFHESVSKVATFESDSSFSYCEKKEEGFLEDFPDSMRLEF
eukprot:CAMPEP_0194226836 /NCGR_PEP_ID=MMETSP0156-20130528/42544_1 /TAXON_ID=33649 /ORGANISM="Thalassionema nitzschioides, Strain L26-B" /LENGTH=725 /DNA_ID=CAMNT_0038959299 /DNA_START=54 /DNA_END=2231 /DNA_ORIENTATION=-